MEDEKEREAKERDEDLEVLEIIKVRVNTCYVPKKLKS